VQLSGEALQVSQRLKITDIKLTISHAREYATATAIGISERF
jgi:phosphopantetheinyl transferase (holo-ACP synthase)